MANNAVIIISDPLVNEFGSCRPTILIAKELAKHNFQVSIVTETATYNLRKMFEACGISIIEIGNKPLPINHSLLWFKSWISEALFSQNSRKMSTITDATVLNFSNTIAIPSKLWYAQGPPTVTLENIKGSLSWHYKFVYNLTKPFLKMLDKQTTKKFSRGAEGIIANSKYLSHVYKGFGIKVHNVIYPPLDCEKFKPHNSNSSSDYVLTYFGKETKSSVIKRIADAGVKIKIFGTKINLPPRTLRKHVNVKSLGYVSEKTLIKLYSNALLTIYPFLDEPFGYVPIESMACGTPVLTFNCQGPSESVIHNITGWLTNSEKSFINLAIKIWKNGYSSTMYTECRKRALLFDKRKIAERWIELIEDKFDFEKSRDKLLM